MKGKMKGEKEGIFFWEDQEQKWREWKGLWKTFKDIPKFAEKRIALQEVLKLIQEF